MIANGCCLTISKLLGISIYIGKSLTFTNRINSIPFQLNNQTINKGILTNFLLIFIKEVAYILREYSFNLYFSFTRTRFAYTRMCCGIVGKLTYSMQMVNVCVYVCVHVSPSALVPLISIYSAWSISAKLGSY